MASDQAIHEICTRARRTPPCLGAGRRPAAVAHARGDSRVARSTPRFAPAWSSGSILARLRSAPSSTTPTGSSTPRNRRCSPTSASSSPASRPPTRSGSGRCPPIVADDTRSGAWRPRRPLARPGRASAVGHPVHVARHGPPLRHRTADPPRDAVRGPSSSCARAMLELTESAAASQWGPDESIWVDRIGIARADICRAHDTLLSLGDADAALRLATAGYLVAWPRNWSDLRQLIDDVDPMTTMARLEVLAPRAEPRGGPRQLRRRRRAGGRARRTSHRDRAWVGRS